MLKSKKDTGVAKGQPGIPSTTSGHNSLVQGTVIEGTLRSENDIRIDGTLKGNLECKSKVIIGPSGVIEGDVNCKDAVIEGQFNGTIEVRELLNVRKTAKVTGEVVYGKLIVEGGSVFNVSCSMGRVGQKNNSSRTHSAQPKATSDIAAEHSS